MDAAGLYLPTGIGTFLKVAITENSVTGSCLPDPDVDYTHVGIHPCWSTIGQGGVEPTFNTDRTTVSFVATKTGALELTVSVITEVDGFQVTKTIGYPPNGIFTVDVKPGVAVASSSYTRNDAAYPLNSYATAGEQHQYQAGGVP